MIGFDIETQPLPEPLLEGMWTPPDTSKFEYGEFDETTVRLGNLKDEVKIKAKLDKAREEHEKKVATATREKNLALEESWEAFVEQSTLHAHYSSVLAIGYYSTKTEKFILDAVTDDRTEADLLKQFWETATKTTNAGRWMIGINILSFDLPYMLRRSWVNGVAVPDALLTKRFGKWPEWNFRFLDLGKAWCNTAHPSQCRWGFKALAAAFGEGGKVEDEGIEGGNWWRYWKEGGKKKEAAERYLLEDCRLPTVWAERMGIN